MRLLRVSFGGEAFRNIKVLKGIFSRGNPPYEMEKDGGRNGSSSQQEQWI
jgi:hypothetical protein